MPSLIQHLPRIRAQYATFWQIKGRFEARTHRMKRHTSACSPVLSPSPFSDLDHQCLPSCPPALAGLPQACLGTSCLQYSPPSTWRGRLACVDSRHKCQVIAACRGSNFCTGMRRLAMHEPNPRPVRQQQHVHAW